MKIEVEVSIVDPYRSPVVGHPLQTLSIPGYVLQLRVDVGPNLLDVDPAAVGEQGFGVEDGYTGHVHMD
jgi:hypothetical protein